MSNPYQSPPGAYGGPGTAPQPPYAAPPYQQPHHPQPYPPQAYHHAQPVHQPLPAPAAEPNQYATAAVVLGFVAVVTTCFYGGFLGLIGLGVALAGLNRSNTTGVGRGVSIGAVVLNLLAVLISGALLVLVITGGYTS